MTRDELISREATKYAERNQTAIRNMLPSINAMTSFINGARWSDSNPDLYSVTRKAVETALKNVWLDAQGDILPDIEKEVIVLCDDGHGGYKVCFAHRPVESYTGVSITNHSEMEEYYPERYDKGGWNIPDVKWWLNVELPNSEETKQNLCQTIAGESRQITHEEICECYGISDIGEFSDGYHTFNGLYKQRMILFAVLVKAYKDKAWKSWKHEDGELCFGGGWFIVGIDTPAGSYTYHYEAKDWGRFECVALERAKHWDGHTDVDVERLLTL